MKPFLTSWNAEGAPMATVSNLLGGLPPDRGKEVFEALLRAPG